MSPPCGINNSGHRIYMINKYVTWDSNFCRNVLWDSVRYVTVLLTMLCVHYTVWEIQTVRQSVVDGERSDVSIQSALYIYIYIYIYIYRGRFIMLYSSCWHKRWRVCGNNLNIVSMCAVSPVVHTSNVSSRQKK